MDMFNEYEINFMHISHSSSQAKKKWLVLGTTLLQFNGQPQIQVGILHDHAMQA